MGNNGNQYFYAMSDSELYDATIELTVPHYKLIYKTLLENLNLHFNLSHRKAKSEIDGVFIDFGTGTGELAISVLKEFPNLKCLAIDIAPPMEKEFIHNYNKSFDNGEPRFSFLTKDILEINFVNNAKDLLGKFCNDKRIGIFSAYCIHHFEIEDKYKIYQSMFDFLEPEGIMVNIDLFNYRSKKISDYFHYSDVEYIKNQFDNPNPEFVESQNLPLEVRMDLKEKWIDHMNNDNLLHSVDEQLEILRSIGFKHAECPFRYLQQGIIVGIK